MPEFWWVEKLVVAVPVLLGVASVVRALGFKLNPKVRLEFWMLAIANLLLLALFPLVELRTMAAVLYHVFYFAIYIILTIFTLFRLFTAGRD